MQTSNSSTESRSWVHSLSLGALTAMLMLTTNTAFSQARLHGLFSSHMVLQRDMPAPIWGWASPGEVVNLDFQGHSLHTKADAEGSWKILLPPTPAGGPYSITVRASNTIVLDDVLFGDVWVCGGQSNMQYTLQMLGYDEPDSARAYNGQLRFINVSVDLDYLPKKDIKGGQWARSTPESIRNLSGVGYFFGQYLQQHLGVPIGLVSSNLGATTIETWMSNEALKAFPQFDAITSQVGRLNKSFAQLDAELKEYRKSWDRDYYLKGPGIEQHWERPETDVSGWQEMDIPKFWEDAGLKDHDGAVWFRKTFDLPEGFSADTFNIALNQIDDYDITWVNGVKVGESFGNRNWRNYFFPASILKPKGNVLVSRVFDIGGQGGFYTAPFWGNPILNGKWKFKAGLKIDARTFPIPTVPNGSFFSHPSLLYNGSIAPLMPFGIRGVIWYQGESNALPGRSEEYAGLLPAMIRDWRAHWGLGAFPFLIVQLANYLPEAQQPGESSWAELREAQMKALSEPHTAIATAIDIGDANDIHPKNKRDLGQRLGLAARKAAYGEDIVYSGPVFQSCTIEGDKARVSFSSTGSGLSTTDKYGYIRGFAIAGAGRKFYWAQAYIDGNTVVVHSPDVPRPVAVRYAWADNPGPLGLCNKEGLPALPFRTDNWELSTAGKKFVFDEHGF
ncbi:MAG: sialate O-acetylesterase [Lewinellaceae bacterium]|nr:sialate O-acetylesterase [Lewinellaceae bacterium]